MRTFFRSNELPSAPSQQRASICATFTLERPAKLTVSWNDEQQATFMRSFANFHSSSDFFFFQPRYVDDNEPRLSPQTATAPPPLPPPPPPPPHSHTSSANDRAADSSPSTTSAGCEPADAPPPLPRTLDAAEPMVQSVNEKTKSLANRLSRSFFDLTNSQSRSTRSVETKNSKQALSSSAQSASAASAAATKRKRAPRRRQGL